MRSEQNPGFLYHLLLGLLRHGVMDCINVQVRMGIGREDILGRLALADDKTKHLHLAIEARQTTDPAKRKRLVGKGKMRK